MADEKKPINEVELQKAVVDLNNRLKKMEVEKEQAVQHAKVLAVANKPSTLAKINQLAAQMQRATTKEEKEDLANKSQDLIDKNIEEILDKVKDKDGNRIIETKKELLKSLKDWNNTANEWFTNLVNTLVEISVYSPDSDLFPWVKKLFAREGYKGQVGYSFSYIHSKPLKTRKYSDPLAELLPKTDGTNQVEHAQQFKTPDYAIASEVIIENAYSRGAALTASNYGSLIANCYAGLMTAFEVAKNDIAAACFDSRIMGKIMYDTLPVGSVLIENSDDTAPMAHLENELIGNATAINSILASLNKAIIRLTNFGTQQYKIGLQNPGMTGVDYRRVSRKEMVILVPPDMAALIQTYGIGKNEAVQGGKGVFEYSNIDKIIVPTHLNISKNSGITNTSITGVTHNQKWIAVIEKKAFKNKIRFSIDIATIWKNGSKVKFMAESGGFPMDEQCIGVVLDYTTATPATSATTTVNTYDITKSNGPTPTTDMNTPTAATKAAKKVKK